jgi:N utilization substance protein B
MARLETRGRARALQAIYAWDVRKSSETLEKIAGIVFDDLAVAADERAFAGALINLIAADQRAMDLELAAVTTNWRLDRIGHIERSVLRLGAAELMQGKTPPRVVIQECVKLAERFGSGVSARFVNGVLDALARRLGRLT